MDGIKRISRFGNDLVLNKDGKPVVAVMTDRQTRLLSFLERNRYASFDDIHAYLKGDRTALRYTIRVLKAKPNFYIKVCEQDATERNLRRKVRYELHDNGIDYLTRNGSRVRRMPIQNFKHAALASHATASIEAGIAAAPNARLLPWADILESEAMPAATKRLEHPNGIPTEYHIDGEVFAKTVYADTPPFGIQLEIDGRKKYRFFPGIEADTGTEPVWSANLKRTSIFAKLSAYLAIEKDEAYRSHFGFPIFFVPFLTTDTTRMRSMMAALEKMTDGKGSKTILFKVQRDDAPAGYLFTEGWSRVGHGPVTLAT